MILLDTSTLIFCLKGLEPVTSRVKAADPREVAIPSIVFFSILRRKLTSGLMAGAVKG